MMVVILAILGLFILRDLERGEKVEKSVWMSLALGVLVALFGSEGLFTITHFWREVEEWRWTPWGNDEKDIFY